MKDLRRWEINSTFSGHSNQNELRLVSKLRVEKQLYRDREWCLDFFDVQPSKMKLVSGTYHVMNSIVWPPNFSFQSTTSKWNGHLVVSSITWFDGITFSTEKTMIILMEISFWNGPVKTTILARDFIQVFKIWDNQVTLNMKNLILKFSNFHPFFIKIFHRNFQSQNSFEYRFREFLKFVTLIVILKPDDWTFGIVGATDEISFGFTLVEFELKSLIFDVTKWIKNDFGLKWRN